MSRTNKPRKRRFHGHGGHGYLTSHEKWKKIAKQIGNRRIRSEVRRRMKDVLFTDAFDEKEFEGAKRGQIFDRWLYT